MDKPMADDIAAKTAKLLPRPKADPRLLPGCHLSLFWGLLRFDFNPADDLGAGFVDVFDLSDDE